jgi:hypothetical protein
MNLIFLERVDENGNYEITLKEGADGLKEVIDDKFVFPQKLVLTAEQKEENKEGLRDLLTGAFCFQEIAGISFQVVNENGDLVPDYMSSLYDDLTDIEVPAGFDASGMGQGGDGNGGGGNGGDGHGGGDGGGGCCGDGCAH